MEPNAALWCIKFITDRGLVYGYKHEVVNAILCAILIIYIHYKPELKQRYKWNILPLICLQLLLSCANISFNSVEYAVCYAPRTWHLEISSILINVAYTIKPFFIMHSLLRDPLMARLSSSGFAVSIAIPAVLAIIPAIVFVLDIDMFASRKQIPFSIMLLSSLLNLGLSVYLLFSGQTGGSPFPMIVAVYECLYALPECLKFSMGLHFGFDYYKQLEDIDDYAFFFTVIIGVAVIVWRSRREEKSTNVEFTSFDNQNVFV